MVLQEEIYCFSNTIDTAEGGGQPSYLYHGVFGTSVDGGAGSSETPLSSVRFNLSLLREKVNEVESFVNIFKENNPNSAHQPVDQLTSSMAYTSIAFLMQEIIETASSMMLKCQEMALGSTQMGSNNEVPQSMQIPDVGVEEFSTIGVDESSNNSNQGFWGGDSYYNLYIHSTSYNNNHQRSNDGTNATDTAVQEEEENGNQEWDVVEIDAADLLARLIHYCQVCSRGFKRETNLRMHMRAHGDKYKASLNINTGGNNERNKATKPPRKYSCPQNGCRWNKNHVKFQPLKSIVCVKNHYKRSHCPKMFMCKRCNQKQFAVLSDLKTHENNCGDIKWYCSCGTTFSKKDKLIDHVALFVGHTPLINPSTLQFA
ncbi:protein SENSITIVE TO PROTON RHIZOTOXICITY 2 [Beta vulgaris subsp. vulgaris]|uniref:protein SENSITIVE TO PROTON RHIZOTOXICITY 2 n=1 Tax=Beta vulgaris subsp. vulgaris TaxID=3555 RepID=UPI002036AEDC|nr:protein SENSITIVE TO PROTON RHIZOTOXICITY 2 [Beta vulgaris subsp. vulgaris]